MKKKSLLLALGIMFSGASQLAAANSADLFIKGRLVPPACTPALDGGAIIDYGDIPVSNLSNSKAYTLEDRNTNLTVTCQEDTALGIRITDARTESKPVLGTEIPQPVTHSQSTHVATSNTQTMGLGNDAAKGKLGVWWMTIDKTRLKATNVESNEVQGKELLFSADNGASWGYVAVFPIEAHAFSSNVTFAIQGGTTLAPAVAAVHTFPLVVGAALNTKGRLSVKDDTKLDGKGTFTIYYQ
ncbi:DUF1120 domain-containing protein [Chromobacterium haemolyticum]|uniref:DUF1120 domain-containing protein n=1 Tax=Chromobacterium haemolyticum TaxID=394935 RepID=UPI0011B215CA|nr:DUF1120 domain-containing protein [Chromobacterium haemolyticum]